MRTVPVQIAHPSDRQYRKTDDREGWVLLWGTEKAHYIRGEKALCQVHTYRGIVFHGDRVKPKCIRCGRLKRKEEAAGK